MKPKRNGSSSRTARHFRHRCSLLPHAQWRPLHRRIEEAGSVSLARRGHKTASGERLNCEAMTAAHRRLPFGSQIRICHSGCVTVRINDRGPWVRGRDIDLSPAAARAIGLYKTGHVTMSAGL
ncbi:MAG: septal ring lytic transglycosylase RlpA family protein [Xanthobacteraceae bacterium]